ncbi:MAG TPA: alanine--tRNA ligase [Terriglobales bacterium]|jgi:alanyl-tRNA synthetase|nr:alanine--tRNA ligase [Terriglobales bacterium]
MLTGSQVRRKFLDFFVEKGHREVHSSSLVPQNDPTLLFTNAGMNQFKDIFLGLEKRDYNRATTSQKCVRAGGKHNDLENVGFTNRHHTFFEMLGNFSFGDYFKKDAIAYAWELITSPQWFGIDKNKLYVTIFNGEGGMLRDTEAYDLWQGQGVPADRIFEFGLKDNFWQMGDTGPCGPCSEIHYDMGVAASDQSHADCAFGCDCGRYVELWNLVFMQFDRDASGTLNPLPKPSIDTGMGLERLTAVLQGVISNYDTDLFTPLIERATELTGTTTGSRGKGASPVQTGQGAAGSSHHGAASLRVIADHSRAATFLISDGVLPSNEGRGYVLRKIIRRAITHGRLLGYEQPFLHKMVFAVRDLMLDAYPELKETAERASSVVLSEEKRFTNTLNLGFEKLEAHIAQRQQHLENLGANFAAVQGQAAGSLGPVLPGPDDTYWLTDTFGLPKDFIEDAYRDAGMAFDEQTYLAGLGEQQKRARASWKGAAKQTANPVYQKLPKSTFEGYRQTRSDGCEVLAIIHNGQGVQELKPGEEGEVILDHTPFYAESGGQVGDRGWFYGDDHNTVVAEVKGCYYPVQGVRAHQLTAKQPIRVGQKVDAVVDTEIRTATMRNHTATHLLQAGLREVLGKHVKQAGSLVAPDHLRFDFSHFTGVADEELQDIEDLINKEVLRNEKIEVIENVPIDVAINDYHAMALFGEKYGDRVRVIKIGDFSTELCGGTHTGQTGEIGLIKVLKEGSVSSGVRRIEAVTGEGSLHHFQKDHQLENVVASLTTREANASPAESLKLELEKKDAEIKRLARELDQARMKSASSTVASVTDRIKDVRGVKVLAHRVDNLERAQMRTLVDQLRDKLGSGVVVLGSASNGNVALIVGVTKDLTSRIQAGKVIGPVAQKVGGKGGGRPDLAEAGGKDPGALDAALGEAYGVVEGLLEK